MVRTYRTPELRYIVFRFPLTLDEVSIVKTVGLRFHPPHFTAVDNQNKESFQMKAPVEHVTRMIHMAGPLLARPGQG